MDSADFRFTLEELDDTQDGWTLMPFVYSEFIPWEFIATIFNALGNVLVIFAFAGAVLYLLLSIITFFTDRLQHIPTALVVSIPIATFLSLLGFVARIQTPSMPEDLPVGLVAALDPQVALLVAAIAVPIFLVGTTVRSTF